MNIFYLSSYPKTCAEDHCDKHVVKMIVEYAQLLSTAHRILDGEEVNVLSNSGKTMTSQWKLKDHREKILYKCAHINHPSNIWVRAAEDHYIYLLELWNALSREYTIRYDKVHSTWKKLVQHLNQLPNNIDKNVGFLPPPQCMPDECKKEDTVDAYRDFYKAHKREFATWKTRIPLWFN
tara:strand:+ start:215 stop:751 length:537 start_codon:yes stop_codon:yes gene_type:complete